MSPIKPHWAQPSHPHVQEVIVNEAAFTTKSLSKTTLPPFGLFAKMDFPPCTVAPEATYATVQTGRDSHLDLNSDLLYINHSCEPSLVSGGSFFCYYLEEGCGSLYMGKRVLVDITNQTPFFGGTTSRSSTQPALPLPPAPKAYNPAMS